MRTLIISAVRSPVFTACLLVLFFAVLITAFGALLAPQDPMYQDIGLGVSGPSVAHWLGTDELGRDVFARLIAGARTGILGAVVTATGATLIGTTIGLASGYTNRRLDTFLMRAADIVWAFPALLTILVVVGVFGGGYWLAVAMLILFAWPMEARLVRGATMVRKSLPYVEAAHTLDLSHSRIVVRHILPNLWPLVLTNFLLGFVSSIAVLSGLSFLGLGVAPGTPDWGLMINENRQVLDSNVWGVLAPALCLIAVSLAATIAADRLYTTISIKSGAR
ncbi:ABC transporter permease [Saccharopolyspora phatthalungensis]|uniref:ABC-type dipeptide/oligopeptide/nickel transport system permease subunit n=1 Tax=Saccharopolyspora phatthalungensis TaxID=664693 RepID=A0A840QHY2_9PSEU|nr:ABC transporter permease [Saccharopolyspora phatthalungensis]MBB5159817.1 ABC-type dipeptide/oligopeptide/nickel transport system permease subunit [Saccharopolyspora phatthalungensis]